MERNAVYRVALLLSGREALAVLLLAALAIAAAVLWGDTGRAPEAATALIRLSA